MHASVSEALTDASAHMELPLAPDARGRHRIQAELKRLEQEARFLEEELNGLDSTDLASTACQELLSTIEAKPDPLLPVTAGPANPLWDRWFKGPQDLHPYRCSIM